MMKVPAVFSSFAVKLFLWFWLVVVISVFSTHFISATLSENNIIPNNTILPPHREDMRYLHRFIRYSKHYPNANIAELSTLLRKNKNRNIWLENTTTNEVFSIHKKSSKIIKSYLQENTFKQPKTIQFKQLKLTGPLNILIKNTKYKIYLSTKLPHEPPLLFIPLWLRITIPVLISFILLWMLARSVSKPLLTIKSAANKLGNGDLTTRVPQLANRNDELGQLAQSFNQMAEKLASSVNAQQRLLADVSHELRTPMTRLQLAIALAHKSTNSPDELEKYLLRCETEISRLDEMLANVIHLSRLENTLPTLSKNKVNLTHLIGELINDSQFIANEKNIEIVFENSEVVTLVGDEQLLASAIGNILSNAVKYSDDNTQVVVKLFNQENNVVIEISDNGKGVPEESLAKLFQPFYRVDNDRARTTGGSGLGLAIAKQAILAHHGAISAYNNSQDNQGLTVVIKLPYA